MTKKIKTLIIALGALVLLGGGYFGSTVYQKKKAANTSPSSNYEPSPKIGNLESSKLVKIEIPGITLEKKENLWELVSLNGKEPPGGIKLEQSPIESMTYSLASVWVERILEEEPADLSVYGLDDPSVRAVVTDSDGKRAVYKLGDMTPSRTSYYVMEEGDPKVYIVSTYSAGNMMFTLDKIRDKFLFPQFEIFDITNMRIELPGSKIEIRPKPETVPAHLNTSFSSHIITSPYKLVRGVDGESLDKLVTPLKNLFIETFVEDTPSSLAPYGLDKPVRLYLETIEGESLDLLIGNPAGGGHYAKLAGSPGVFTISGLDAITNVKAFSLIDKFALLVNIDTVEHLSVIGDDRYLGVDFQGKGEDGVYVFNGKKAETKSFKTFYQAVIGLLSDAEIPGGGTVFTEPQRGFLDMVSNPAAAGTGDIKIEYLLDNPPGTWASITLAPYNRDFYALRQEGTAEFLISRNQVRKIYETADAVIYE
jgi:hypothetical protein